MDRNSLTPLGSMEPEEVKAYLQIESEDGSDGTWYAHKDVMVRINAKSRNGLLCYRRFAESPVQKNRDAANLSTTRG
ncbi:MULTISPECIES: hypothetical protein [Rhizobium]|uniref:Uncharacterized protein n=1 Tax=Rhizobium tropici TaxID=398 RepID=A0A6P1CDC9_RHITR|nr:MULTISPECIES: hypothetical protein [Rhizobium]MBB4245398.1 hypothetical protein [Rhizobium tropici]MBB5596727.1 hypothetical protein [Rhizobium tropici]MBB6495749.1 hypothetical protein [Rhizobium tropici]NEV15120.1 hypothetical protein [Rhizobium tropici]TGE89672.1 hypothetical protein C9417_30280 [Rhizobium sp. SEMIA 4088]